MGKDVNPAHRDAQYVLVDGDPSLPNHCVLEAGANITLTPDLTGHRLKIDASGGGSDSSTVIHVTSDYTVVPGGNQLLIIDGDFTVTLPSSLSSIGTTITLVVNGFMSAHLDLADTNDYINDTIGSTPYLLDQDECVTLVPATDTFADQFWQPMTKIWSQGAGQVYTKVALHLLGNGGLYLGGTHGGSDQVHVNTGTQTGIGQLTIPDLHGQSTIPLINVGTQTLNGSLVITSGGGNQIQINVSDPNASAGRSNLISGSKTITTSACTLGSIVLVTNMSSTSGLKATPDNGQFIVTGTGSDAFSWLIIGTGL